MNNQMAKQMLMKFPHPDAPRYLRRTKEIVKLIVSRLSERVHIKSPKHRYVKLAFCLLSGEDIDLYIKCIQTSVLHQGHISPISSSLLCLSSPTPTPQLWP